jgi:hypothetical protein
LLVAIADFAALTPASALKIPGCASHSCSF